MGKRHFNKAVFEFLGELAENNRKEWWDANKDRYIETVREPALDFINDFGARLQRISPHFVADSRTVGGSLIRPYRDTRFSKDKTPYKTNVGIQFRHEMGGDIHAPGYYLHLEPRSSFAGVGLWHPETAVARTIRQAISDDPSGWKAATQGRGFTETWSITPDDDEMLVRVPKELDQSHPYPEALRMKSFIAGAKLTQAQVTASSFEDDLLAMFTQATKFTAFLCDAVAVPF